MPGRWSAPKQLTERRPESGLVMQLLDDKIMVDYATMLKYEQKLHPDRRTACQQFLLRPEVQNGKN